MENEAKITLGGQEYPLLLTTRAVMEISEKFGGFENIAEKMNEGTVAEQLRFAVQIITLLANQPIMIYNRQNKDAPREQLTEDDVLLLTSPSDLLTMNKAIRVAMERGMKRHIYSEDDPKNADGTPRA